MYESWVLGLEWWVYILCLGWFERSVNSKDERRVILVDYTHDVIVRES